MTRLDLRLRIAATIAISCIAVVAALGITLYTATEEMEDALVEQIVTEEIDFLIERHRSRPDYAVPTPGPNLQYYIVRSAPDNAELPEALRKLAPGQHEIRLGGSGDRHVAVRQVGDTRYLVVYDVGPHELRERRFKHLVLLALATVALIALPLGYWISGVLTRQLTALAQRVAALTPEQQVTSLATPEQDPEVAALARTLDQYQMRAAAMMQREQGFTANASHELRTPLTAIRTSCELLLLEPALPATARERITRIAESAERITEQLQTLLYLAREQPPANRERVIVRDCVRDAAEPYRAELERKGLVFEMAVPPAETIDTDRQALHLVLVNLIRNAARYTERGFVRVSYSDRRLTVADSGSGIPPEHLPRIFERHYRGSGDSDGLGLGLAIVKRICDRAGWTIDVASTPAAGTVFSITLA